MRIIGKQPLPDEMPDAVGVIAGLRAWYGVARPALWRSLDDVLADFPKATVPAADCIQVEIADGYRMTVAFDFSLAVAWITAVDR